MLSISSYVTKVFAWTLEDFTVTTDVSHSWPARLYHLWNSILPSTDAQNHSRMLYLHFFSRFFTREKLTHLSDSYDSKFRNSEMETDTLI